MNLYALSHRPFLNFFSQNLFYPADHAIAGVWVKDLANLAFSGQWMLNCSLVKASANVNSCKILFIVSFFRPTALEASVLKHGLGTFLGVRMEGNFTAKMILSSIGREYTSKNLPFSWIV